MLDRPAGVVSEVFSTTKNISTLIVARIPAKLVGTFFLVTIAVLAQTSLTISRSEGSLVESAFYNLPHLYARIGPLQTKVTKVRGVTEKDVDKNAPKGVNSTLQKPTLTAIETESQTLKTPSGTFKYKMKIRVFATSYDSNCTGCSKTTALGLRAGYGVIAVDPNLIPLGSRVYIPGYGVAVAGDTGRAIKGNKVDLGFDSIKTGWWSSRFTDLYILAD